MRWRRKFFEPGEIELHVANTEENRRLLCEDNIIHGIGRNEAGIIRDIKISSANNGGEEIVATALMGSSLLNRRVIYPTFTFTGTIEDAMRNLVADNAINSRPIENLVLGETGNFNKDTYSFQISYKNLLSVLEALGKSANLGFRTRLSVADKEWIFEVYTGKDHSIEQHDNPYITFSDLTNNIKNPTYNMSNANYYNYAVVVGEEANVDVDKSNGSALRELYVDAKDMKKGSLSDDDYKKQLIQRGTEKLAAACKTENFTADALDTPNYEYMTDWDLGDIVTFDKWGKTMSRRICEVEEVYENGSVTVTPVCGSPLPETLNLGDDQ